MKQTQAQREARRLQCILLVEDDTDIREAVAAVLTMEGFTVVQAGNGDEALRQLRTAKKPNLILLDIGMPVKDGVQFRKEQECDRHFGDIPVIVMTANDHADYRRLQIGAKAALKKPFEISELIEVVTRFLPSSAA